MKKLTRWIGYGLGAVVALIVTGFGWVWLASSHVYNRTYSATAERLPAPSAAQIADAARQAHVLGCVDCHGQGLRGKRMFDVPNVATVWAPDLGRVAARSSDQQLAQAIRQGIGRDGHGLWIMPSGLFSRLSSSEVAALIMMLRRLPDNGPPQPEIVIGPLGRIGIATGKFSPAPERVAEYGERQPFYVDAAHEPGRRIAATACAGCHAPDLGGGESGFDKTPPDLTIAAGYDLEAFRRLLRTGQSVSGRDLGLMRFASRNGLAWLRDDEIEALHSYLKARAERVGS